MPHIAAPKPVVKPANPIPSAPPVTPLKPAGTAATPTNATSSSTPNDNAAATTVAAAKLSATTEPQGSWLRGLLIGIGGMCLLIAAVVFGASIRKPLKYAVE